MKHIQLHSGMGPAVLEHLGKLCELPEGGFVAGQAVASAVSELFFSGRAVKYNDVDLFRECTEKEWKHFYFMGHKGRDLRAIGTCDFLSATEEYMGIAYGNPAKLKPRIYTVAKVTREGLLNTIACDISRGATVQSMLHSFDMNNVQVGVHLPTKQLVWTSHFEEFMRSYQLEIVRLHTPLHSLIRYFTKREELDGVYGNDDRMTELVAAAYQFIRIPSKGGESEWNADMNLDEIASISQWQIGKRYQQKLAAIANKVAPNFTVNTSRINDYDVQEVVPRFDVDKDLLAGKRNDFVDELPMLSKLLREKHASGLTKRAEHLLSKPRSQSPLRRYWALNGLSFLKGNVSASEIDRMDNVLSKHNISSTLVSSSVSETRDRLDDIRKEVNERGNWVYGMLERSGFNPNVSLADQLDTYWKGMGELKLKPLLPQVQMMGYDVIELTTGQALLLEGETMHHCIGGYGDSLNAKGYHRFFSFRPQGKPSNQGFTAMYKFNGWKASGVVQVHGLLNRSITDDEHQVLKAHFARTELQHVFGPLATVTFLAAPDVGVRILQKGMETARAWRKARAKASGVLYLGDDIDLLEENYH